MTYLKIALIFFLPLLAIGLVIWHYYLEPKLTMFDEDRRVENFRNMQKLFPNKPILASSQPYQFKENLMPVNVSYSFLGEVRQMWKFLERISTTGLLVIKDDVIVCEKYFLGNTKTSKSTSWSVAKSFTSALMGIAINEGCIDSVNDPITKYVPELGNSAYNNVPIKHILQMSSGVNFNENYGDKNADINKLLDQLYLYGLPADRVILNFPSQKPSGEFLEYVSINTQILSLLLKRVTKKDIASNIQEKIWQPMGAEYDAYWLTDLYGNEVTFCGLNATLRDYAKFGLLYLHGGKFNNKQIIPEPWVKESTIPDRPYLQPGATGENNYYWGYQYHWWVPVGSQGDYCAAGAWGQYIYINPEKNLVIAKSGAGNSVSRSQDDDETIILFRAIAEELTINN
jgi:CubicO group peptidase (beta-lactamase class C family)